MSLLATRGLGIALGLVLFTRPALANPGINGYSGKPAFGMADTCDSACHAPTAPPPKLVVTIPETVQAGSTSKATIVVDGTRARTSLNAAFSDGVKAVAGTNTEVPFPMQTPGEVVAVTPPPAGAKGTYELSFVAPATNGTITLWIAGMSADGTGSGGDGVAKTMSTITVTGGTTSDEDGGAPSDAGVGDGGTPPDTSPDASGSSSSSGSSGGGVRRSSGGDDGGCSVGPWRASRTSALGWLPFALAVLGLARRRVSEARRGRSRSRPTTSAASPAPRAASSREARSSLR